MHSVFQGIPLIDESMYQPDRIDLKSWESAYPDVNVERELMKIAAWSRSNPTKRKTPKGVRRFVNLWLAKEQDKGGPGKNDNPVPAAETVPMWKWAGFADRDDYERVVTAGRSDPRYWQALLGLDWRAKLNRVQQYRERQG